jgi:uncharacterized protein
MNLAILNKDGKLNIRIPSQGDDVLTQVLLSIASTGIVSTGYNKIQRLVALNGGKVVKVADEVRQYDRSDLRILISDDLYEATLHYNPSLRSADPPSFFEILWQVVQSNISYGILFDEMDRIVKEHDFSTPGKWMVARGHKHTQGKDACFRHEVEIEVNRAPLVRENGKLDYKNIGVIRMVTRDQKLLTKFPPTRGSNGITVYSEAIEVEQGKDLSFPKGENTYISEDGIFLHAELSGHLYLDGVRLCVDSILIVKENVDYSTGNIRFPGDVLVMGSVMPDFEIEAHKDIFVKKDVQSAKLTSKKGHIEVMGGIFGRGKAELNAKRSIKLEFADDATLVAGEDINANKYLTNCRTTAGGKIKVQGAVGEGAIIGGTTTAGFEIMANSVGSETSGKTRINIIPNATGKGIVDLDVLELEYQQAKDSDEECQKAVKLLGALKGDLSRLKVAQRLQLQKLVRNSSKVKADLKEIESIRNAQLESLKRMRGAPIQVAKEVFSGVDVRIMNTKHRVSEKIGGVVFSLSKDGGIELKGY